MNTAQGRGANTDNQGVIRRIPPPPPFPPNNNNNVNNQNFFWQQGAAYPWVLKIQCQHQTTKMYMGVRIQVYPTMTTEQLGRCIVQAVVSSNAIVRSEHIEGLFRDHDDGIFYSLQHILSHPDSENYLYSIDRPIPRPKLKHDNHSWSYYITTFLEYGLLGVGIITLLIVYGPTIMNWFIDKSIEYFYLIFDLPIREIYRYGPYMIGWEGMDLPDVCSRITYYGDRMFWTRNYEECENIYYSKEEVFVRTCRPVLYILLLVLLFIIIRHLIAVYAESKRDRTDRAVIETYHAFQTLIRLANRQGNHPTGRR